MDEREDLRMGGLRWWLRINGRLRIGGAVHRGETRGELRMRGD